MTTKGRWFCGLLAVALAATVVLTGCVTMRSETTIRADGGGTLRLIAAINRQVSDLAGGSDQVLRTVKARLEGSPGVEVSPYLDPITGQRGVQLVMPFKSLDELGPRPDESSTSLRPYEVDWSRSGTVTTLTVSINIADIVAAMSQNPAPMNEQDRGLVAVFGATAGLELRYALALPGQILDCGPKADATYDPARNELSWVLRPSTTPYQMTVQWDSAAAPEPIDAPITAPPALNHPQALANLKKYVEARSTFDESSIARLLAPGAVVINPFQEDYPDLFAVGSYRIGYTRVDLGEKLGAAEWAGKWKLGGKTYDLSGVDIFTFDLSGQIQSIQVYVDPTTLDTILKARP